MMTIQARIILTIYAVLFGLIGKEKHEVTGTQAQQKAAQITNLTMNLRWLFLALVIVLTITFLVNG